VVRGVLCLEPIDATTRDSSTSSRGVPQPRCTMRSARDSDWKKANATAMEDTREDRSEVALLRLEGKIERLSDSMSAMRS
jgi:hypothetical protein